MLLCLAAFTGSCATPGASSSLLTEAALASPSDQANTPSPSASATLLCPSAELGSCLGPLAAGTYETAEFATPFSYTVPDGWANYEDLPGNFLLLPPTADLPGVNNDTSEFIGLYDGVAPASANCDEVREPGVETTPDAMAIWYASHPGLSLTNHQTVNLGGLEGLAIDINLADGYDQTCWYTHAGEALVPLLIGDNPAGLHHVINASFTTRLYLLTGPSGRTLAIEVVDHADGLTIDELSNVVETIDFAGEVGSVGPSATGQFGSTRATSLAHPCGHVALAARDSA